MMLIILITFLLVTNAVNCETLEEVSDDDLLQLIKSNEYTVTLFSKYFTLI